MRQERESFIMGRRRRFSAAFPGRCAFPRFAQPRAGKRQVVEELLAGAATPTQLCRRYELCYSVLRPWKEQYAKGQLADPQGAGQGQEERLREVEGVGGELTM